MGRHLGSVDRLVTILENAQVPVGAVRERLGIPGMTAEVADNFRDKARMKAGVRGRRRAVRRQRSASLEGTTRRRSLSAVGYPFVAKPPAGAGARNTFRVDGPDQLAELAARCAADCRRADGPRGVRARRGALVRQRRRRRRAASGTRSAGTCRARSTCSSHPWIQWCVLLPAPDRRADVSPRSPGSATTPSHRSGCSTGLSHLEWFRRDDGSVAVSEVGARPPGAQFMTLMSFAHDIDMYAAWARLAVDEQFDPPHRGCAVGAAYLRAQGPGRAIIAAHGLDQVSRDDALARRRRPPARRRRPSDRHVRGRRLRHRPRPRHRCRRAGARRADLDDPAGDGLMDVHCVPRPRRPHVAARSLALARSHEATG